MAKSILEESTVNKRFLFPRKKHFDSPYWIESDGYKLSCFRMMNHPSAKTLVVFHASSEIVADYLDVFVPEIDRLGYNILIAEYRGYSLSEGYATLTNIIDDLKEIINASKVAHENLVVFGRSIGSIYAVNAVSKFKKIKGLIIDNGIADFYERLNRRVSPEDIDTTENILRAETLKFFNIEKKIKAFKGNTLILHANEDRIINVQHAKQIYKWAAEPKLLKLFNEGDHNLLFETNRQEYFDTIKMFMESV